MSELENKVSFSQSLHKALIYLYDPYILLENPLVVLFDLSHQSNPVTALQDFLNNAINSLAPDSTVPLQSTAKRIYQILYYRFIEQSPQRVVASDLGLSIRQLRREEKKAIHILAETIWSRLNLKDRVDDLGLEAFTVQKTTTERQMPSRLQELAEFTRSQPIEPTDIQDLISSCIKTVFPLAQNLKVKFEPEFSENLPLVAVSPITCRQILFNILTIASRCVPGGYIQLSVKNCLHQAFILIKITAQSRQESGEDIHVNDELLISKKLAEANQGYLDIVFQADSSTPIILNLYIPSVNQLPVLVIDDNVDTLMIIERYFSGSRYRFIGTADPNGALALAMQVQPVAIMVDIMMSGIDGWELLGRLVHHPQLQDVPVIVCSILQQEQLALSLGAVDFVRKPFKQSTLISILNRQIFPWLKTSPNILI